MLIDTNVWSELARPRPDANVGRWMGANFDACILSTPVLAEMRYGIAQADDIAKRNALETFHDDLILKIGTRVAAFDPAAAMAWGSLKAQLKRSGKLIADMDMLIAAQALALGVPLVTRNTSDLGRTGAMLIDPWRA